MNELKLKNKSNLISVIMSVCNDKKTVSRSITSILDQTYKNFEFLIMNDGSEDNTQFVLDTFKEKDRRIKLFKNSYIKGLSYSLNFLIKKSRGEYIARMDSDDFSLPSRLEKQIDFMNYNKNIDVLGTGAIIVDKNNKKILLKDEKHQNIKSNIFITSPFVHPTVMARKNFFRKDQFYNLKYKYCQDYELWFRSINSNTFHNLPEPLLEYNLSKKTLHKKLINSLTIRYKYSKNIKEFFLATKWNLIQIIYTVKNIIAN